MLCDLVRAGSTRLTEVLVLAHTMGGLVARSARAHRAAPPRALGHWDLLSATWGGPPIAGLVAAGWRCVSMVRLRLRLRLRLRSRWLACCPAAATMSPMREYVTRRIQ